MTLALPDPTVHVAYKAGACALLIALGAILGALAFQHIGGIVPCELCLKQRYAYYVGAPLLFLALVLLSAGQRRAAALLFAGSGGGFVAGAAHPAPATQRPRPRAIAAEKRVIPRPIA